MLRASRNTGDALAVIGAVGMPLLIAGVNAVLLLATKLAFDAWLMTRFGYLNLDMVGPSARLWLPLVILATALALIGLRSRYARVGTVAVLGPLALIVVEQGIGALRDGEVSAAGAATGGLMILQVLALGMSVGIASGRARPAMAIIGAIGAVIVLAGGLAVVRSAGPELRETVVRQWLDGLASDPIDRGWSHLDATAQALIDRDTYFADAAAVDWASFRWELDEPRDHGGAWSVNVIVDGGLASVPDLFFDHRIAFPLCLHDEAPGFGVWVEAPLVGEPAVGGGFSDGRTCPETHPEEAADPVRWSDLPGWTGFRLELWNRTTTDLFLVDRNGVRVDLPACGRASTNALDLSQMVEVRADDGYVSAFETGDLDEMTTYMVVMAGEPSMNVTPPIPPLPPCQGEPQVQAGF